MSLFGSLSSGFRTFFGGGFEAAEGNRRLKGFQPSRAHVNTLMASAGRDILARARHLVRNNGYASNAVEAYTGNAVGDGIVPSPAVKAKGTKTRVVKAWQTWVDEADFEGLSDFYGVQRRVARELYVGGEVFVRMVARPARDGLLIPFQLQVVPSEMLPIDKNEPTADGGRIRQGIEFDAAGRRVAYHFYRRHPGDYTEPEIRTDTVRVPAADVLHIRDPQDAGQLRGVSRFAPAIVKLFCLDAYDDAELDRKKVAAMHALFITSPDEDFNLADEMEGEPAAPTEETAIDLQPGTVVKLDPGEEITTSTPADSGRTYEPFQYRTLLQVSAALGIPYAILTNDMVKANYSNTRAALLEFRRRVQAMQFTVLIPQLCQPVFNRFLDVGEMSGAISLPGYDRRWREYRECSWLPPRWEWVDPLKDVNAEIAEIGAGLKSRTRAIAERGYDAEQVDEEIAADREREKRLGLTFETKHKQQPGADGAENRDDGDGLPRRRQEEDA